MTGKPGELSPELLERVLVRLGINDTPTLDLQGLDTVYQAWCGAVPFDNLRKLIHVNANDTGTLPGDESNDFFEAWLKYGTGGTCWAGNGALHDLLVTLGFPACRGVGTMMVAPNIPPNHGTVLVKFDESQYLVDASIVHMVPILLDSEKTDNGSYPAWVKRVFQQDSLWHISWLPLHRLGGIDCRIDSMPATWKEFHDRHETTRLWSPFNYELNIRTIRDGILLGIAEGMRVEISIDGKIIHSELSPNERREFLINKMGINEELLDKLPGDRPTPPPPWSKTAHGTTL